ncbi:MAG: hypothetical protein IH963_03185 [Chloroflexi bacterium]|nr:hypothetical protein [Chloroflexota bacterium]
MGYPRPAAAALLQTVNGGSRPNKVLVGADNPGDAEKHGLPRLEARGMFDGKPTAYVCQNYACQLPVTTPAELAARLVGYSLGAGYTSKPASRTVCRFTVLGSL